ncbi:TPA: UDP-N-acetylglucosamine 1-carboxyvinyltransferase [Candidatus Poribacteria bacterium]|nr:UDP-N-acetylglucosamine 1-carboxyvinyltransferase [Candidatus Poribacteria bacterium]
MDKFIIQGGRRLEGTIVVSGSKNATLPIAVAAAILGDGVSTIHNVPLLQDVNFMCGVLEVLGAKTQLENSVLTIDPGEHAAYEAPYDLVRKMRASIYVLGPLVAKLGRARVSFPGGCAIGTRPVDLHLTGLENLGAQIKVEHGYIVAEANKLVGSDMSLRGPSGSSVGATGNVMMAATLAEGTTTIFDAACEPEIVDLANFLNAIGANIEGAGTPVIKIHGVKELSGTKYSVIPDRIEAGTFMAAAAITKGDLLIKHALPHHLGAVTEKLIEAGVNIEWRDDGARVTVTDKLRSVDVRTSPFPGFPTDMQAQMIGLMSITEGISVITETIFPDRFIHVSELNRMGASIRIEDGSAIVKGVEKLSGASVMASDLRAGAVLVLAGLAAEGETTVLRVYHIDRGYEYIERKLAAVGASIVRVS